MQIIIIKELPWWLESQYRFLESCNNIETVNYGSLLLKVPGFYCGTCGLWFAFCTVGLRMNWCNVAWITLVFNRTDSQNALFCLSVWKKTYIINLFLQIFLQCTKTFRILTLPTWLLTILGILELTYIWVALYLLKILGLWLLGFEKIRHY